MVNAGIDFRNQGKESMVQSLSMTTTLYWKMEAMTALIVRSRRAFKTDCSPRMEGNDVHCVGDGLIIDAMAPTY